MRQSQRILSQKMATVPDDLKEYFKKLIVPLATTASLESMFTSFTNTVISKLEKRLDEQAAIINQQNTKIEEMESRLALRQNIVEKLTQQLEYKTDDIEQYSRRSCLRINGIEVVEGNEDINETLKECYRKVGVDFQQHEIDCAHRVGNHYIDKISKKTFQSIIVKYKSWGSRCQFYKARPKAYNNGVKKAGSLPFTCSVDLSKSRYNLLRDVRGIIKHYPQISYAFADLNCNLAIRLHDNECKFFKDKSKLDEILGNLDFVEQQG